MAMRPIFNFGPSVDDNDPFPPVNRDNKDAQRRSLLPRASIVGRPSLLSNRRPRPSVAPSAASRRHASSSSAAAVPSSSAVQPTKFGGTAKAKNNITGGGGARQQQTTNPSQCGKQQQLQTITANRISSNINKQMPTPGITQQTKSANKLSTIKERQSEGNDATTKQNSEFPEQMQTDIDTTETKLRELLMLEEMQSLHELGRKIGSGKWKGNGKEMGELLELCMKLGAKRGEFANRMEAWKRKREEFKGAMEIHAKYLTEEVEEAIRFREQINGLMSKLEMSEERTSSAEIERNLKQQPPGRPEMADKEVQANPERTLFTSPSSIRRTQIPTSPVLRTGKRAMGTPFRGLPIEHHKPIGSPESKENELDSVMETPKGWNQNDKHLLPPLPELNFDETTTVIKRELPQDATYVINRPTVLGANNKNVLPKSASVDEFRKPTTPILRTDMKKQHN